MYEYNATLIRIVDGDTVWVDVDLGLDIHHQIDLRLYGINAPEMKTKAGQDSRAHLVELMQGAGSLVIQTEKDRTEKYGRYLATLLLGGMNINQQMVTDGFAVPFMVGRT